MAPILGYWKVRAVAEPVRMMLRHLEIEFEDRRIADPETWFGEQKFNLGLDFPNLPYYIDGDLKITQCLAIARHIARKNGLFGETDTEFLRQSLMEQVAEDLRWGLIRLILNPKFESLKDDYISKLPDQLKAIDKYVGEGPWIAGQKLTYVDFILFETLDQHLYLVPKCLDGLDNLIAFRKRFKALPNVKAYMESDKYERWPLFGSIAFFGNTPELPPPTV